MTSNAEFEYDLGVVGLGYVGLPLAVESSKQGLKAVSYTHLTLPTRLPV